MKGLVLGPLHTVQANQSNTLSLQEVDPEQGTKEDLRNVLEKAHRKGRSSDNISYVTNCHLIIIINRLCAILHRFLLAGSAWFLGISVMLDLTPNYLGSPPWFTPIEEDVEKVKVHHRNGSVVVQGLSVAQN